MTIKPPLILAVRPVSSTALEIQWANGEVLVVDLSAAMDGSRALAPLREPALFARAEVDEWGHAVEWPGDIDQGADRLYEMARHQAGLPAPADFDAWMRRNALSLTTAAEAVGLSRRTVAHYRTGSRPIPRLVGLAMRGWEVERGEAA